MAHLFAKKQSITIMHLSVRLLLPIFCLSLQSLSAQILKPDYLRTVPIRSIGPGAMSGRITAIAVDPERPDVIYAGAASGGVWRSTSGGTNWEPIFDGAPTQSVGALAINPNNPDEIWVGTGEGNPRNSQNFGAGIFKSIDGGKTWKSMGLENTHTIHRIVIHRDNPQVVFAASLGSAWGPNADRGVFKSTDGGQTWRKVLYVNDLTGCADLVTDPSNPNKLFAAMWEYRRWPWFFNSGGKGSGCTYRTTAAKPGPAEPTPMVCPKVNLAVSAWPLQPANPISCTPWWKPKTTHCIKAPTAAKNGKKWRKRTWATARSTTPRYTSTRKMNTWSTPCIPKSPAASTAAKPSSASSDFGIFTPTTTPSGYTRTTRISSSTATTAASIFLTTAAVPGAMPKISPLGSFITSTSTTNAPTTSTVACRTTAPGLVLRRRGKQAECEIPTGRKSISATASMPCRSATTPATPSPCRRAANSAISTAKPAIPATSNPCIPRASNCDSTGTPPWHRTRSATTGCISAASFCIIPPIWAKPGRLFRRT
ncbi:MAG: hypothetical protein IT259_13445 [Saprospiraceae bacterium]|nr:hypothetical protein [Saprospiraceae bacterium]